MSTALKREGRGYPFSPCSYASRPLGLWRFAPCFALQNARGAIFARALASELADALRLIIRGLTAFGGEPPARATKQKKGTRKGRPFSPCSYASRPLGLWRLAPCFALQNARGAIFARALASELADALRLIIRGLTAFGGEPPARATNRRRAPARGALLLLVGHQGLEPGTNRL